MGVPISPPSPSRLLYERLFTLKSAPQREVKQQKLALMTGTDGRVLWRRLVIPESHQLHRFRPMVVDLDGDQHADIVTTALDARNTWELRVFSSADGRVLWTCP